MTRSESEPVRLGEYQASRWAAAATFTLGAIIRPWRFTLGQQAIETHKAKSAVFWWIAENERLPYESIASVKHDSGLIWDRVTVESRGGSNVVDLPGLRKKDARQLAQALRALTGD